MPKHHDDDTITITVRIDDLPGMTHELIESIVSKHDVTVEQIFEKAMKSAYFLKAIHKSY